MSDDDRYRVLLEAVSHHGVKRLSEQELEELRSLLQAKDYANNKKADKSRKKLLTKINAELYNKHNPRRLF